MRGDGGDEARAWAVQYDDGMSLTTASEQVAHRLAEAERQRGHRVTVRRLDDAETHPQGAAKPAVPEQARRTEPFASPEPVREPVPAPAPQPVREPEPAPAPELAPAPEPARGASPPGLIRQPGPARPVTPARRRRVVLYLLAAACIVVAAALADHWNVLPRVGAGSSPAQVSSLLHGPHLLPPLGPPPVMHFGR